MDKIILFDVETTGLIDPEIIQIYAVGFDQFLNSIWRASDDF